MLYIACRFRLFHKGILEYKLEFTSLYTRILTLNTNTGTKKYKVKGTTFQKNRLHWYRYNKYRSFEYSNAVNANRNQSRTGFPVVPV